MRQYRYVACEVEAIIILTKGVVLSKMKCPYIKYMSKSNETLNDSTRCNCNVYNYIGYTT